MDTSPLPPPAEDEISLLDLLVTVSENIKLLILGPLAAGLCALGVSFTLPATYESVAILPSEAAGFNLNSTLRLPSVLDPVVVSQGLGKDKTVEQARLALNGRIKTVVGKQDKFLTLTVSGDTPGQAQAIAKALLAQSFEQLRPRGSNKVRIERQLAQARDRLEDAQKTSKGLLTLLERGYRPDAVSLKSAGTELPRGYADLLAFVASSQSVVVSLEQQLEGLTNEQLLQAPSLPEKPVSQKKAMVATVAALGTGFALLLWVFVRSSLRAAGADPVSAAKLAAIRRALGFAKSSKV
jgi:uncharacterized protein involved in exopolysaccharide biosynthesis